MAWTRFRADPKSETSFFDPFSDLRTDTVFKVFELEGSFIAQKKALE